MSRPARFLQSACICSSFPFAKKTICMEIADENVVWPTFGNDRVGDGMSDWECC